MERMPRIGPYSSCATLSKLDGRTKQARLVKSLRAELLTHVGNRPTVPQRLLIDQACQLQLRLALMDAEGTEPGGMTERNQVQYLAWSGSLARILDRIGMKAAPERAPTLAEIMAGPAKAAA